MKTPTGIFVAVCCAIVLLAGCASRRAMGPSPEAKLWINKAKSSDVEARQTAYRMLPLLKSRDMIYIIPVLIRGLKDDDKMARFNAYNSLTYLTGREEISQNPDAWTAWWVEHKETYKKNAAPLVDTLQRAKANLSNDRGILFLYKGWFKAAENQFVQAIALDPTDAQYWNNRGLACYHQRRYDDAINFFDQAYSINKKLSEPHMNVAQVYEDRGQFDLAIYHYRKATGIDNEIARLTGKAAGRNWAAHHRLARVYLKQGVNLDAAPIIASRTRSRLADLDPVGLDPEDPTRAKGRYLNPEDLVPYLKNPRRIDDDAMRHAQADNAELFALAIAECELAATIHATFPDIYVTLALASYGAGQYHKSWIAVEKVHELGYTWESTDFIQRALHERKRMEPEFVEPAWVKEILRAERDPEAPDTSKSPATRLPQGYRRPRDYNSGQ